MKTKQGNNQIVGFLSLEDFASDVIAVDDLARVQPIMRSTGGKPEHSRLQWIVLVTALTGEGIAMTSILTGQRWEIFDDDDGLRKENAEAAAALIRKYLENQGYATAPGVYSPQAVMDNIVRAGCKLWRFEEGQLVANATDEIGDRCSSSSFELGSQNGGNECQQSKVAFA